MRITFCLLVFLAWNGGMLRGEPTKESTARESFELPVVEFENFMVRSFNLNQWNPSLDGQWQGIFVASDGRCYFAGSSHSEQRGAAFFCFDPATQRIEVLCEDISIVCGEKPGKVPPQGKIHSPIVEFDGWLYFGTHLANYSPEGKAAYTGGHLVGYELATGKFRNIGPLAKGQSIYSAIGLDAERGRVYISTTPYGLTAEEDGDRLWSVDLKSDQIMDLGVVPGPGRFWVFVDAEGDCWMTGPEPGSLQCYRWASKRVEVFKDVVPGGVDPEEDVRARSVGWMDGLGDGHRCVVSTHQGQKLWIVDTEMIRAGSGPQAFTPVAELGGAGATFARCGRIVYLVRNLRDDQVKGTDFELGTVDLKDPGKPPRSHGRILDQDARRPWRIPALAADENGNVYMVGDWHVLTQVNENGLSLRLARGETPMMRLAAKKGEEPKIHPFFRALFFATGSISQDASNERN